MMNAQISDKALTKLEREVTKLLRSLKQDIGDEYRASDDDTLPSMQVTIGATPQEDGSLKWNYQTGDNSYTGGAYGHPHWGVVSLYRRSNCAQLAKDCVDQIAEAL